MTCRRILKENDVTTKTLYYRGGNFYITAFRSGLAAQDSAQIFRTPFGGAKTFFR